MSLRRQCYEWRNIVESAGDTVFLNGYPVNWTGNVDTVGFAANQPVDIFVGGIGNNIDIPGQLKAYQYVVIDAVAVYPPTLHAQIYVNTTKYFQDPDNVPSRNGGISGFTAPFPQGASFVTTGGSIVNIMNYDFKDGLKPAIIIEPGQNWGVEVTSSVAVPSIANTATGNQINKCFVKYLLIDGADAIVARRLLDAGWPLSVENVWKYKQDIIRSHLYAGLAPLPEEVSEAKRKV